MNLKLIVAALAITAAVPICAQAQESKTDKGQKAQKSQKAQKAPASKAAPVNKVAAAQKVLKAISSDNAKKQTYCDIGKLAGQIEEAEQKKDMNKIDELNKKVGELGSKLGPEYVALVGDLEEIDPDSKDGHDISAAFAELDKQCAK